MKSVLQRQSESKSRSRKLSQDVAAKMASGMTMQDEEHFPKARKEVRLLAYVCTRARTKDIKSEDGTTREGTSLLPERDHGDILEHMLNFFTKDPDFISADEPAGERACLRGKGVHRERGRTRPVVQYEFNSALGYPGEGPEHNEGGAWVTVNVAGVHVSVSREASDVDVGEAGSALIHDYSDKLWELVQVRGVQGRKLSSPC